MDRIPFSKPFFPSGTSEMLTEVLKGEWQQGDGPFCKEVEDRISLAYSGSSVFLVPSCTAALEFSLMLLDVGPGDEVILPSFTFTSMATAITKFWATPVFCDIDFLTGCMDTSHLRALITKKTKAISWVNYGGNGPNVQELVDIAREFNLALIEDAAHNYAVPTINQTQATGDFVAVSFHATKNLQCGEGGGLIIRNNSLVERAHSIREKGTNRRSFIQGKVNKYQWVDRGSSYLLSEISSGILLKQLESFDKIQSTRTSIINHYFESLTPIEELAWKMLLGTERSAHLFALVSPSRGHREAFIQEMNKCGVSVASHYEDLSSSPAGIKYRSKTTGRCPNSEMLSERIVRLPVYPELLDQQVRVINLALEVIRNIHKTH